MGKSGDGRVKIRGNKKREAELVKVMKKLKRRKKEKERKSADKKRERKKMSKKEYV